MSAFLQLSEIGYWTHYRHGDRIEGYRSPHSGFCDHLLFVFDGICKLLREMVDAVGIEPTTSRLRVEIP